MAGLDKERRASRPKLVKMKTTSSDMYKRSTESNLYCSAESDFKSTSSISSGAYFSAESDVEDAESITKSDSSSSKRDAQAVDVDGTVFTRPHVLDIMPETQNNDAPAVPKTPLRKFSVKKQALTSSETLIRSYERILPSSRSVSTEGDVDSPLICFTDLTSGVHPSVIVKKDSDFIINRRYSMDVLNQADEEKFNSTNINLHVKVGLCFIFLFYVF